MTHETLDLFGWTPESAEPRLARERSIDERFAEFHAQHPIVFDHMLAMAQADLAAGKRRVGVKALWERLRETLHIEFSGTYKLNNTYTSRYADACIAADPRLASVIEVRKRKS